MLNLKSFCRRPKYLADTVMKVSPLQSNTNVYLDIIIFTF